MNLDLYLPTLAEGEFWQISDTDIKIVKWSGWSDWSTADWYARHPNYDVEERTIKGKWWDRLFSLKFGKSVTFPQYRYRELVLVERFTLEQLKVDQIGSVTAQDALDLASRIRQVRIKDRATYGIYDPNALKP